VKITFLVISLEFVANIRRIPADICLTAFVLEVEAFGNEAEWINAAIRRALAMMSSSGLDVRFVSFGTPSREIVQIARDFAQKC